MTGQLDIDQTEPLATPAHNMQPLSCPSCGYPDSSQPRFCRECGAQLAFCCRRCWESVPRDATYCPQCGVELSRATLGLSPEAIEKWRERTFAQAINRFGLMPNMDTESANTLQRLSPPVGLSREIVAFCIQVSVKTGIWGIDVVDSTLEQGGLKIRPAQEEDVAGSLVATNYRMCIADYHHQQVVAYSYEDFVGCRIEDSGKKPDELPPIIALEFAREAGNDPTFVKLVVPRMLSYRFNENVGCLATVLMGLLGGDAWARTGMARAREARRDIDAANEREEKAYIQELDNWLRFFDLIIDAKNKFS